MNEQQQAAELLFLLTSQKIGAKRELGIQQILGGHDGKKES